NELTLSIQEFPISTEQLAELIALVDEGKVSFSVASQKIYPELLKDNSKTGLQIAQELNLIQESDEGSLKPIVEKVLAENTSKVAEYKSGKKGLMGMFMGQVMKQSKGKADPKVASRILAELLED